MHARAEGEEYMMEHAAGADERPADRRVAQSPFKSPTGVVSFFGFSTFIAPAFRGVIVKTLAGTF